MAITDCPFMRYDKGVSHIIPETMLSNDIRIILCASGYTPNTTTHQYYSDITNELATANGYTAGGLALSSKTLTESGTPGTWIFSSANPVWDVVTANLVAKTMVMYNNTPVANKPLLGWGYLNYNGGTPLNVTTLPGVPLTIALPTNGWFTVSMTNPV